MTQELARVCPEFTLSRKFKLRVQCDTTNWQKIEQFRNFPRDKTSAQYNACYAYWATCHKKSHNAVCPKCWDAPHPHKCNESITCLGKKGCFSIHLNENSNLVGIIIWYYDSNTDLQQRNTYKFKKCAQKSIFSAILQHQKHMSLLSWHSWTVYSDVLCRKPCNLADFVMKVRHTSAVAKMMATGNRQHSCQWALRTLEMWIYSEGL